MESCGVRLQLVVEKASGGWMLVPSHVVPSMGQWAASSHLSPRHLLCPLLMTDTCLFLGPTVYFRCRVQQAQSCGCFYYFLFLFYFGFKNHLCYLWAFLYLTPLLLSSPVYFCVKQKLLMLTIFPKSPGQCACIASLNPLLTPWVGIANTILSAGSPSVVAYGRLSETLVESPAPKKEFYPWKNWCTVTSSGFAKVIKGKIST